MKTTPVTKLVLFLLFLLGAGSAALAIRTSLAVRDLEKRAAATKDALDGLADSINAREEMDAAARKSGSEGDGASKRQLEAMMLKLGAVSRRLDALEAGDIENLGIETLIDRKLLEKMPPGRGMARRFAQLDAISEKLGLSDAQKRRAAEVIDRAKTDVIDILRAEDEDGLSMSERIAEHVKEPGTRAEKTRRILTDLFDKEVPGTSDSYFSTIMGVRQNAITDFKGGLTDQQLSTFGGLGIDVFGIETGYSPFAEEMKSALTGKQ
jgi:hypothetical protein